jgi:hypothetical protein
VQRLQPPGTPADPVGERRTVEADPLAGVDLDLPIEGKVIGVLGDDDVGDQCLGRQAAFDQPGWGRRLHHRAGAGSAGVLGPANYQDPELGRHHIQPLGDVLADLVHLAGAARTGLVGDVDHHLDPRQMRGQGPAVDLAARAGSRRRCAVRRGLDGGDALLDFLERQCQLVGIEPLRAPAEAMALQFVDDGAQPIALIRDARNLLGMTRALGDE